MPFGFCANSTQYNSQLYLHVGKQSLANKSYTKVCYYN